jgi:hypothetical protein
MGDFKMALIILQGAGRETNTGFFVNERAIDCREGLLYIWEDDSSWLWGYGGSGRSGN